jgi:hypothetical protein
MAAVASAQPHWRRPSFVTTSLSPGILTKKKQPSRGWAPQSGSEDASLPYKYREEGGGRRDETSTCPDSQCEYRSSARLGARELEQQQQQNNAAIDPSSESPTACRSPEVLTHGGRRQAFAASQAVIPLCYFPPVR